MDSDFKRVLGCGTVLLLIGIMGFMSILNSSKPLPNKPTRTVVTASPTIAPTPTVVPTPTAETGETMSAIRASKKIARAHVDSATSCKFHDMPWYYAVTYLGNDKYRVTGEVEMQSIFGQTRTRKYVTTFVLLPDDEYDPDDVTIKWYDD